MQIKPFTSAKDKAKLFSSLLVSSPYQAKKALLEKQVLLTPEMKSCISRFSVEQQYAVLATIMIGQGHIFTDWQLKEVRVLESLAALLYEVERLYQPIGGIIGYDRAVKQVLDVENEECKKLSLPEIVTKSASFVAKGIESIPILGELYPVGGAADRLNLQKGNKNLPAAKLELAGRTLLEHLIRGVEAREYLYYKLFSKQVKTPIGLMTSGEKSNHDHIVNILDHAHYFYRGKENFFLFKQPAVPCVDKAGRWLTQGALELVTKPGGHGVIWVLAEEKKVYSFFKRKGVKHLIVRQINNPVSSVGDELLSLAGYGVSESKGFGFLTCPKKKGANEGMIAEKDGVLTNVEYPLFQRLGITEKEYEKYPANTNTLFASIETIQAALKKNPFPGKILNFSKKQGNKVSARLETMMQNLSEEIDKADVFVHNSKREDAIGAAKKGYKKGGDIFETPLGAIHTLMAAAEHLLREECQIATPGSVTPHVFEEKGPKYFFQYNPALGPVPSIIGQKMQGGTIAQGSFLQLEIAELLWRDVTLQGALSITAEQITGHREGNERVYSDSVGQCVLHNVTFQGPPVSAQEMRSGTLDEEKAFFSIHMQGSSQFSAVDVHFKDPLDIVVPDGMHAHASMKNGEVSIEFTSIDTLPVLWKYSLTGERVTLT